MMFGRVGCPPLRAAAGSLSEAVATNARNAAEPKAMRPPRPCQRCIPLTLDRSFPGLLAVFSVVVSRPSRLQPSSSPSPTTLFAGRVKWQKLGRRSLGACGGCVLNAERRLEETRRNLAKEKRRHASTKKRLLRAERSSGKTRIRDRLGLRWRRG